MNSMELQDAILRAVDTLAQNRIDKIKADKTITCSISKCTNALTGEYKVSYNGGFIYAYASGNTTYENGAEVYVLVPEGDFSNKKMIVSLTTSGLGTQEDSNQSAVSAALSNYNLIGNSVVKDPQNMQPVGLHSYYAEDYQLLYQHSGEEKLNPSLGIDIDGLTNSLLEAEAVMLRASFQTRLPKKHRLGLTGEYGLTFTLAFADRDNVDVEGNPGTKYYSYSLTSSAMSGNPFNYSSKCSNYQIFSIDTENFLYIDSILFYSKGFEEKTVNTPEAVEWGADIFVSNIQFYGMRPITATSGEYTLSLSQPDGVTFKDVSASSYLDLKATVKKSGTDISDSTVFYWFKADSRVTTKDEEYQAYGGTGYACLREKNKYGSEIRIYGNENKAYENGYLVVAVYKETIVLKDTFIIYNDSCKRDLSIESSLGVKFSFDRGTPTLTCLIDGNASGFDSGKKDDWFSFVWSKVESDKSVSTFNQSYDEVQAEYKQKIKDGASYSEVAALRSLMTSLDGVSWDKNTLTYPISKIDSSATFKCGVFLKDGDDEESYSIGEATVTLQNEDVASPTDYYIVIENGDQVFQYSESGVAPNSDRYTDPLEIKNLICHFYDPAGLEVNSKTYEVKWLVPLTDTMIVTPTESMVVNPATEKIEWYTQENYRLIIDSDYNSLALNNQVQAIVTYQGQTYTQYTSFLFTKIGENGTNGTDIVAKISANNLGDGSYLPYIDVQPPVTDESGKTVYPTSWTDGNGHTAKTSEKFLSFNLYQRGSKLGVENDKVIWKIAGGTNNTRSKYLSVNGGAVSWSEWDKTYSEATRNQVVRGSIKYEGADYYAFYPVPVIERNSASATYPVRIPSSTTLKTILYNADGSNPIYNKNQCISIELDKPKYVVWRAGVDSELADFKLIKEKNSANGTDEITDSMMDESTERDESGFIVQVVTPHKESKVYILPNDKYIGGGTNNIVHAAVYTDYASYLSSQRPESRIKPELDIYIPLFLSLNTYGLSSLNAWDGNSVEINEDENYILAPQIGAGEKDSENKFTGIVMGKAEYYDKNDASGRSETSESIGLLGYSKGRQSIFLNAEDGSATFGLPESELDGSSNYNQGRIELVPNGTSSIGSWKLGSRSLYNIVQDEKVHDEVVDLSAAYSDLDDKKYVTSIPHDSEGVLLSSNPAYLSIKGRLLKDGGYSYVYTDEDTPENSDADFNAASTVIQPNDSLELQLDPNDTSIFTMYRHTVDASGFDLVVQDGRIYGYDEDGTVNTNNPYAIAIYNDNNSIIIGWEHYNGQKTNSYKGKYVIARPLYDPTYVNSDTGEKGQFTENWYFCLVDKPGNREVTEDKDTETYAPAYYLPERATKEYRKDYNIHLFKHLYWHREAKVGINSNGRFYTNALKDSSTALTIGELGSYGKNAAARNYVGASFEIGDDDDTRTLVKFFTNRSDINNKKGTLYISGATDVNNEYQRPLVGAFKDISLYAADSASNSAEKETNVKLYLGRKEKENVKLINTADNENAIISKSIYPYTYLGGIDGSNKNRSAYLALSSYYEKTDQELKGERSTLYSNSGLTIGTPYKDSSSLDVNTGCLNLNVDKSSDNTGSGSLTLNAEKASMNFSDKVFLDFNNLESTLLSLEGRYGTSTNYDSISTWFGEDGVSFKYGTTTETKYTNHLTLALDTVNGSSLTTDNSIKVSTTSNESNAIRIESNPIVSDSSGEAVGGNIKLTVMGNTKDGDGNWTKNLTDATYLTLTGGSETASNFTMGSKHGSISSVDDISALNSSKMNGVQVAPTLLVPRGIYVSGNFSGTGLGNTSIIANQDIKSINGWMYALEMHATNSMQASDFILNSAPSIMSEWSGSNKTSYKAQLSRIYEILRSLQTQVSAAKSRADSAYSYADSAYSYADRANTNANGRVSQSAYNNHTHHVEITVPTKNLSYTKKSDGAVYNLQVKAGTEKVGTTTGKP